MAFGSTNAWMIVNLAIRYNAAKAKLSHLGKQYNLKFDDTSLVLDRKFYGSRISGKITSPGRFEYAP